MSGSGDKEKPSYDVSSEEEKRQTSETAQPRPVPPALASVPRPSAMRRGSRPDLPSLTVGLPFDSKSSYYKYLRKKGEASKRGARAKRRQVRDTLAKSGETNFHAALQSSSSSEPESDEDENSEWERETVDWQTLAHESWWAKECLFGIMPVPEISSLVGWATHQTHDGSYQTTTEDDSTHHVEAEEEHLPGVPAENSSDKEQAHNSLAQVSCSPPIGKHNPLLFLPNAPLPPSHLQFLAVKARAYVKQPPRRPDALKSHGFLTLTSDDGPEPVNNDETCQTKKKTLKKRKRLVTTNVSGPLDNKVVPSAKTQLFQTLDDSALVALGMAWEDMVTASLLPLAQRHVAQCRKLEQGAAALSDLRAKRSSAFQEWTLPPEQAIWRLAQERNQTERLTSNSPTFAQCSGMSESSVFSAVDAFEAQQEKAVDSWCRRRELDPTHVSRNMDLYGVFLPRAPTINTSKAQSTATISHDEKVERRYTKLSKKRQRFEPATSDDDKASSNRIEQDVDN